MASDLKCTNQLILNLMYTDSNADNAASGSSNSCVITGNNQEPPQQYVNLLYNDSYPLSRITGLHLKDVLHRSIKWL